MRHFLIPRQHLGAAVAYLAFQQLHSREFEDIHHEAMSRRAVLSRFTGIDNLGGRENILTANPVFAKLNGSFAD